MSVPQYRCFIVSSIGCVYNVCICLSVSLCMGLKVARRLTACVVRGDKAVWDHLRKARVFKSVPHKLRTPSSGIPGLSKVSSL